MLLDSREECLGNPGKHFFVIGLSPSKVSSNDSGYCGKMSREHQAAVAAARRYDSCLPLGELGATSGGSGLGGARFRSQGHAASGGGRTSTHPFTTSAVRPANRKIRLATACSVSCAWRISVSDSGSVPRVPVRMTRGPSSGQPLPVQSASRPTGCPSHGRFLCVPPACGK